ncbi:MAG: AAA family ATPase [Holosporaceae bacterium]|jgi:nucleoside-triphosphatase THEP1|nr:AAA family ATPase [Holosporaceae bacterium]
MAIYSLHVGFVSRSSGRSAVQSAAYICGENLHEERRDKMADYSKKAKNVAFVATLAPEQSRYKGLEVWNAVENFEDNYADKHFKDENARIKFKKSAQTAQTVVVALPNEFSLATSKELLEKFINTRFVSRGLITTYAIHNSEGNSHAHLQISRRAINENGDFLERKDREICTRAALLETRKLWADMTNEFLARDGLKERITEKSFADLGINLEATKHRGWYADIIGTDSRIAQENLEISKRNEEKILMDPSIILDYLNEKSAVFSQKDILNEIGKRVFEGNRVSAVFEKVLEEAKYVGESINGEFLYTGERYQKLESDVLSKFDILASQEAKTVCRNEIILSVLEEYPYLNKEQKVAVEGLCENGNVGILLGRAGAGKTTTMKAVSDIYKNSGARVIGMSLSAVASENLGRDAAIESATIASWSHRWRSYELAQERFLSFEAVVTEGILKQFDWYNDLKRYENSQLKSGDVIIVDEAGMVGAKDWKTILDAAERFGAKIIAVGDDNQFKAISAGDCLRQFINMDRAELNDSTTIASDVDELRQNVFELSEIHRQREKWQKEASVELSKLNVGEALAKYENNGRVHTCEIPSFPVAKKYLEIEKIGSAAVLCSTNRECTTINDEIRFLKKEKGELGKDFIKINDKNFAENDKVIFQENNKLFDVKNGQVGLVKSFYDGILSIETESGTKNINVSEYDKINHGYAITLHKSQGKTFDNTIVVAGKMMDAKAMYVSMTRHRENVDLYYKKSDFGSFRELVNAASRYAHKDSLEDYRNIENKNKARVFEYRELLLETASVQREINIGEAAWEDYWKLKEKSNTLGKEILQNYESSKLYLHQMGITKEKLEIAVGVKLRPLSNVELDAKNTVELYAKTAGETRTLYKKMKAETFNIKNHVLYKQYSEIRDNRNEFASKILSNYPLHREFVREISKQFFISRRTMENQVNYEKNEAVLKEIGAMKIARNPFSRLIPATGEFIKSEQSNSLYKLSLEAHRKVEGYGLYVSSAMLDNYVGSKGIEMDTKEQIYKYASILVQKTVDEQNLKAVSPELLESCIKRAICFEALMQASGKKELTPKMVDILHNRALILSDKLTDNNIRVLNDKSLMERANSAIHVENASSLSPVQKEQIIDAQVRELNHERQREISQMKELEKSKNFEIGM